MRRPTRPFRTREEQDNLNKRPWNHTHLEGLIQKAIPKEERDSINKILDVGFGKAARSTRALASVFPDAKIVAIDNNVDAIEAIHKNKSEWGLADHRGLKFYFGDPELALPKGYKADLIVLCLVMHCFDYPYRALAHLVEDALEKGGKILFVHRNDPFMKAICGVKLGSEEGKNEAAQAIITAWNGKHPDPSFRLISEHTAGIEHFLKEAGLKPDTGGDYICEGCGKEDVQTVITNTLYSPLRPAKSKLKKDGPSVINDFVRLSYETYSDEEAGRHILEFSKHVLPPTLYAGSMDEASISSLLKRSKEEDAAHKKDIEKWFVGEGAPFDKETLKYGFHVDLRRSDVASQVRYDRVRNQIWWDETPLHHDPPKKSQSLIYVIDQLLRKSKSNKDNLFFAMIWVYLPDLKYWFQGGYKIFDGILDIYGRIQNKAVQEKTGWQILPYVEENSTDFQNILQHHLGQYAGKATEGTVNHEMWEELSLYLTTLVKVLRREEISHTYYFTFRDAYSKESELIAFSFQSTRWLSLHEVAQLGIISQGSLAAINEGMSSKYRLDYEDSMRIRERLEEIKSKFSALSDITRGFEEIQEIMDPSKSFKGAQKLDELAKILDKQLFKEHQHQPENHKDASQLKDLLLSQAEVLGDLKKNMGSHRSYGDFVDTLFSVWMEANIERGPKPLPSLCLAKSISRYELPLSWLAIVSEIEVSDDYWRYYVCGFSQSAQILRLLAGVRTLFSQLKVNNAEIRITAESVILQGKPDYEDYNKFVKFLAHLLDHGDSPSDGGSTFRAVKWLMEDLSIYIGSQGDAKKGKRGVIRFGENSLYLELEAGTHIESSDDDYQ